MPSTTKSVLETSKAEKTRVIVTSDGEIDDECSMVRFLLYANEWDIEGIVTSSSQYHWHGHNWAGDDWIEPSLDAYTKVYPNLIKHDSEFPTPDYLRARTFLGNVKTEGEMDEITPGSQHIVKVLLDKSKNRPVWDTSVGRHQHHRPGSENHRRRTPKQDGRGSKETAVLFYLGTGFDLSSLYPPSLGEV